MSNIIELPKSFIMKAILTGRFTAKSYKGNDSTPFFISSGYLRVLAVKTTEIVPKVIRNSDDVIILKWDHVDYPGWFVQIEIFDSSK